MSKNEKYKTFGISEQLCTCTCTQDLGTTCMTYDLVPGMTWVELCKKIYVFYVASGHISAHPGPIYTDMKVV